MNGHGKSWFGMVLVVAIVGLTMSAVLALPPPKTISYQGYLKDGAGKPVTAATRLTFRLYSSTRSTTGAIWDEGQSVTPVGGVYSVELGSVTSLAALPFDVPYFLGVTVASGSELTPRQALTGAPYSFRAGIADSVSNLATLATSSQIVSTLPTGTPPLQVSSTTMVPNLNADLLDGMHAADLLKKYAKVAVVAQSGGDYTSPLAAMSGIAGWCGSPSNTNRCLLKIMPGIYNIGNATLVMQGYVDIEGSGENTTVITGTASDPSNGVVNGANNAEIRFLTISNTGTLGTNLAAMLNSDASPKMTHLTAIASGTGGDSYFGVINYSSSPSMSNVTATASGGRWSIGVENISSSPTMSNVTATASGGTVMSVGVQNNSYSSPIMSNVTATSLGGGQSIGVDNFGSSSPTMNNVTATASGGMSTYGVSNNSLSSPTMNNVTATASGASGGDNIGVYNLTYSSPTMINVTVTATGSGTTGENYGVINSTYSSPKMVNVTATGSGGSFACGMSLHGSNTNMNNVTLLGIYGTTSTGLDGSNAYDESFQVIIDHSIIQGTTNSISIGTKISAVIGASKLAGATTGVGSYKCVGVYNDTYTALNATCK